MFTNSISDKGIISKVYNKPKKLDFMCLDFKPYYGNRNIVFVGNGTISTVCDFIKKSLENPLIPSHMYQSM